MRKVLIAVGIALFLVALVTPTAHARPNEWYTIAYHTVKPGETLFSIGRLYGVSPWAIASHNGIVNPNRIYAWQVLAIPNAYWWPGPYPHPCYCRTYHTVVHGQNLYRISLLYGVSMWHIARCNGIYNLNHIWAGQTLCIP
jgi:LysM repeat protein